jgi:hypothetical protein
MGISPNTNINEIQKINQMSESIVLFSFEVAEVDCPSGDLRKTQIDGILDCPK